MTDNIVAKSVNLMKRELKDHLLLSSSSKKHCNFIVVPQIQLPPRVLSHVRRRSEPPRSQMNLVLLSAVKGA